VGQQQRFKVGGEEIFLSREEVEERLQYIVPEPIREVSVEVNSKHYPVKQALAESTGLLRGNFTSHDAMRVFRKLSLPLKTEPAGISRLPSSLGVFENTEELACSVCKKPYMFEMSSETELKMVGCSCNPRRIPDRIPSNAMITNLGGIWVIRAPKQAS
jgi:hypothetical protein